VVEIPRMDPRWSSAGSTVEPIIAYRTAEAYQQYLISYGPYCQLPTIWSESPLQIPVAVEWHMDICVHITVFGLRKRLHILRVRELKINTRTM